MALKNITFICELSEVEAAGEAYYISAVKELKKRKVEEEKLAGEAYYISAVKALKKRKVEEVALKRKYSAADQALIIEPMKNLCRRHLGKKIIEYFR